jgi:hypothetical protein
VFCDQSLSDEGLIDGAPRVGDKRGENSPDVGHAYRREIAVGWRLVTGLVALAVVALAVSILVIEFVPGPDYSTPTGGVDPSPLRPWAACARAVRQHLADRSEVEVEGPTRTRWESSGAGVDLTGRASGAGMPPIAFGCHAIRLGSDWHVERLIFTDH